MISNRICLSREETIMFGINLFAVVIVSVLFVVVSRVWYSTRFFADIYMEYSGVKELAVSLTGLGLLYLVFLVRTVVLAVILKLTGAHGILQGACIGLLIGFGFMATKLFGEMVWEHRPLKLTLVRSGYDLVSMAVAGAILGFLG